MVWKEFKGIERWVLYIDDEGLFSIQKKAEDKYQIVVSYIPFLVKLGTTFKTLENAKAHIEKRLFALSKQIQNYEQSKKNDSDEC